MICECIYSCLNGLMIYNPVSLWFLSITELALLTNKPRAASVYAVGEVRCACESETIPLSPTHNKQSIAISILAIDNRQMNTK